MSVAKNRERGLDVEDNACERWPAEPIADDREARDGWYDLELVDDVSGERVGEILPAGTKLEVKSCYDEYDVRPGRWWIRRERHERLVDADGAYVLAVVDRESDDVLRMALVDAATIDALIEGWWDAGGGCRDAQQYRQIQWTDVFDRLDVDMGGASA